MINARSHPLYLRGKEPVPIVLEAGRAPRPIWKCAGKLESEEIRSLDLPDFSQSLQLHEKCQL